ncbi:MAG: hypothetical protein EBR30_19830 [Cytophagia bacterium]|nr:hypothetical protein [Cytophagia bacterium]
MKNLPENEWMKMLEGQLRNYSEQPDEAVWDAIAQSVQPQRDAAVWKWLEYSGSVAAALLTIFLMVNEGERSEVVSDVTNIAEIKTAAEQTEEVKEQSEKSFSANSSKSGFDAQQNEQVYATQKNKRQRLLKDVLLSDNGASSTSSASLVSPIEKSDNSYAAKFEKSNITLDTLPIHHQEAIKTDTVVAPIKIKDEEKETAKEEKEKDRDKRKPKRKPLTLYAQLKPSLSYYAVQPFGSDEVVISGFSSSAVLSSDRFGFAGEVGLQRKLTKKFDYILGLSFYKQNQTLRYQTVNNASHQVVNSSTDPFTYITIPQHSEHVVRYDMTNVGLTAGLLYELKKSGLVHRIGLSGTYQQGFHKAKETSTYINKASRYGFYNVLYRIEYPIRGKLTLYAQPTFTRSFYIEEKLADPFSLKLSRAGIGIGVLIDF